MTKITAALVVGKEDGDEEVAMPILMIALLALAVFSVIGILLLVAVILEQKETERQVKAGTSDLGPQASNAGR